MRAISSHLLFRMNRIVCGQSGKPVYLASWNANGLTSQGKFDIKQFVNLPMLGSLDLGDKLTGRVGYSYLSYVFGVLARKFHSHSVIPSHLLKRIDL
jgi:hypothetical protein